jgi:hypothetical protein
MNTIQSFKSLIVTLAIAAMLLCFSACADQIDDMISSSGFLSDGPASGGVAVRGTGGPSHPRIGMSIDSIMNVGNKSIVLLVAVNQSYQEDSIFVFTGWEVTTEKFGPVVFGELTTRYLDISNDTVDFRKKSPFQFQLKIDGLSPMTTYRISVTRKYFGGRVNTLGWEGATYCIPKRIGCSPYVTTN